MSGQLMDRAAPTRMTASPPAPPDAAELTGFWGPAQARRWQHGYARRLTITDAAVIALALAASHTLRVPEELWSSHWLLSAALLTGWMAALHLAGSRDWKIFGSGFPEYRRVVHATFALFGLLAILAFAMRWEISRGYLLMALPLGLGLLLISRWLWRRQLNSRRRRGRWRHRSVVVGEASKVAHVAAQIRRAGGATGITVTETITHCSVAGIVDTVTSAAADMVILTSADALGPKSMRELGWQLSTLDVDVVVAPSLTDVAGPRIHARPLAGLPLIHVDYPRLSGRAALVKRCFDIAFSLTVLTLLAPLLAAVAVAVRWDSPGPAFFRQERIGLRHTRFGMLKFRSMVTDAEEHRQRLLAQSEGNGVLFKMKQAPGSPA